VSASGSARWMSSGAVVTEDVHVVSNFSSTNCVEHRPRHSNVVALPDVRRERSELRRAAGVGRTGQAHEGPAGLQEVSVRLACVRDRAMHAVHMYKSSHSHHK
jgi:hypothetical protein